MTSAEWIDMLRLIPEAEHGKLVIVLRNGTELCVDTLVRFDDSFLVLRGRQGGNTDEARGFFVPYTQMLCLRLDRIVKVEELEEFFGPSTTSMTPLPTRGDTQIQSNTPTPTVPTDPAVASRLLLERIRAVRASSISRYSP
jgi:hypothetical protein